MVDLSIELSGLRLRNPFILASGVVGASTSLLVKAWDLGYGAVVTKTYTVEPREGYKTPIIVGVPCGYINAVGLENPGIDGISEAVNALKKKNAKIIVSIAGKSVEEFKILAQKCVECGVDAIELNLSCPHAKGYGLEIGMDKELTIRIVKTLKNEFDIPVFPKFGYAPNVLDTIRLVEIAGADGVVLINTIRAMKIDVWIRRPVLSNKIGGLSGPAIHPIAVALVYQAYQQIEIPIIACGGVWTWEDAVEFFLAGARAVQIGSVIGEKGLEVIGELKNGLQEYLKENGFKSIREIIGLGHKEFEKTI